MSFVVAFIEADEPTVSRSWDIQFLLYCDPKSLTWTGRGIIVYATLCVVRFVGLVSTLSRVLKLGERWEVELPLVRDSGRCFNHSGAKNEMLVVNYL